MNTKDQVNELTSMIMKGEVMEAFEKLYAEDVVMQENDDEPMVGKEANRAREIKLTEMAKSAKPELKNVAVEANVSFCEWAVEITLHSGDVISSEQISRQVWNDEGLIVNEKYYHKGH